jgi:hypothetical protein
MNKTVSMAVVAALCVPAAGYAQSIEFSGAEVSYEFHQVDNDGFEFDSYALTGSAEALIMGQVTAQLDLTQGGYDGEQDYSGYALHAGYMVAPGTVIGGFFGSEDWDGFEYQMVGAEASYAAGPLAFEAAYSSYTGVDDTFEATMFRIDAAYEVLPGLTAVGDFTNYSDDFETLQIVGVGASYDIFEGVYVEGNLRSASGDFYDATIIGVKVGYRFDGGTTFSGRDWNSMLTAY